MVASSPSARVREEAERWQDGRHQRTSSPFARLRLVGVGFVTLAIFALDTFTTMSSAIAVLYVLVLVAASASRTRKELWWLCGGCVCLTVASFFSDHDLTEDSGAALRMSFSLIATVTVSILLVRNLETRQRYEAQAMLLDATADAIVLRDLYGVVLLWNQGAEKLYGVPRTEMVGKIHHDVLQSGFSLPFAEIEQELHDTNAWNGEIQQVCENGRILMVASRWTLQRDGHGKPWAVLETSTDITARKAADRALNLSERRYRSIFETLAVAVLEYDFTAVAALLSNVGISDLQGRGRLEADDADLLQGAREEVCVINANPTALALMGLVCRDQFLERYCHYLPLKDEDLRACLEALRAGDTIFTREVNTDAPGGTPLALSISLHFPPAGEAVDRIQCSMVNLTEHKRMADDLARMRSDLEHAMRITTVGEVSATIAHEVNQPLAAIRNHAEAAQRWLARGSEQRAQMALREIASAASHASDIVKGVRRLLSRSELEDLPVAIDEMIVDAMRLVRREVLDSQTELTLDLAAGGAEVAGDRLLLKQAIVNLATNAIQAMQGMKPPRSLRVSTWVEDNMIVLTVRDNGPGFSNEIIADALSAFATTRSGGMGLGLAICKSAVEAHGGYVRIENQAIGGAQVLLALPRRN
jgi:PAS domain S-box-containing protein